jgi:hypothetical protein
MNRSNIALVAGIFFFILTIGILIAVALNTGEDEPETAQTEQAGSAPTATAIPGAVDTPEPVSATETPSPAPTETPPPAATVTATTLPDTPVESPTSQPPMEVLQYRLTVVGKLLAIASSLDVLGQLLSEVEAADLETESWRRTVVTNIVVIRQAHQTLSNIVPPEDMGELHAALLEATGDCNDASQLLATGLGNVSTEDLEQGLALMRSCGQKFEATTAITSKLVAARITPTSIPDAQEPDAGASSEPPEATSGTQPQGPTALAENGNVNVRGGPSADFPVVSRLPLGQSLPIVGRNEDSSWWQVSLADGSLGWVAAEVTLASDVDQVPVVEIPELPEN